MWTILHLTSTEAMQSPLLTLLEASLCHAWQEQGHFVLHFTEKSYLVQRVHRDEQNHVLILLPCCHWKEGVKSRISSPDLFKLWYPLNMGK